MNFVVRSARPDDVAALVQLASGVKLLSLVPDVENITQRVAHSCDSFAQRLDPAVREYIFVAEELSTGRVVGTSALYGGYVSEKHPMHCAQVVHHDGEQCYSRSVITKSFSGIGGFTVDAAYRRHPDKVGTQLGMLRVLLCAMHAEWFTDELFVEIVAQISADGQSRFWNRYGKRFTGLCFSEAYEMARTGKRSFMDHFPIMYPVVTDNDCMVPDEVCIPQTARGSQHLAKKLGFEFMGCVDPMDGALQYRARRDAMPLVKTGRWYTALSIDRSIDCHAEKQEMMLAEAAALEGRRLYLACCYSAHSGFRGGIVGARVDGEYMGLDSAILHALGIAAGGKVFAAPYDL